MNMKDVEGGKISHSPGELLPFSWYEHQYHEMDQQKYVCFRPQPGGKCPEISTFFALKHAHLPPIVNSITIDGLRNGSRRNHSHSESVNSDWPAW